MLLLSLAALGFAGRGLLSLEAGGRWGDRQRRIVWRGLAAVAVVAVVLGVGALAVSSRGLSGQISHQVDSFQEPKAGPGNDPGRLISSNGSNRWIWWQEAVGAFADKPLGGWGAGSFPVVRNLYRRYDAPVRSTHSVPLQFLSETGLVGAALGLGGLGLLGAGRGAPGAVVERGRTLGAAGAAGLRDGLGSALADRLGLGDTGGDDPGSGRGRGRRAAPSRSDPGGRARRSLRRRRLCSARRRGAGGGAGRRLGVAADAVGVTSASRRSATPADGQLREASADAELAQKLNPLSVEPLFVEANMAQIRGDDRRAADAARGGDELAPDNYETWQRARPASRWRGAPTRRRRARSAVRPRPTRCPSWRDPTAATCSTRSRCPPERSPTAYGTPPP